MRVSRCPKGTLLKILLIINQRLIQKLPALKLLKLTASITQPQPNPNKVNRTLMEYRALN